jgi:hypothetical protein
MTDDNDLEALLARQADEVRQFVERARAADAQGLSSLARQVSEAMDLGMADVVAAVRKLGLSGTAVNVSETSGNLAASGSLSGTAINVSKASDDLIGSTTITGSGSVALPKPGFAGLGVVGRSDNNLTVVKREDIANLAAKVTRDGIAGLSTTQVLALVLVWLLVCITFSLTQQLPGDPQGKLTNDLAELTIGIMLTLSIIQKRKR